MTVIVKLLRGSYVTYQSLKQKHNNPQSCSDVSLDSHLTSIECEDNEDFHNETGLPAIFYLRKCWSRSY